MKFPSFFSKSLIAAAVGCIVSQVFVGCTSCEETKKLADAGNPEKQYEVALMYRDGDGVPVDNKKYADYINIDTEVGVGTTVEMIVNIK